MSETVRELSRVDTTGFDEPTSNDFVVGCQQRIADALESIAESLVDLRAIFRADDSLDEEETIVSNS